MSAGLLDYVTYKYVVLKDRRLGVAYYVLAIAILIFTVTEVFVRKGYLKIDSNPQGVVRAVVSEELSNEYRNDSEPDYCNLNVSCQYHDPLELNWPMEGRAVTITTFAKEKHQRLQPHRIQYEVVQESNYYTLGPEHVVMKVDHAVVASLFTDSRGTERLAGSKRTMKGYLVNQHGQVMRELSMAGKPDKITLKELLNAAGIESLDIPSVAHNSKGQNLRQRGAVLRVSINYQNWFDTWIGTSDMKYFYRVRFIPYMDYNCKQIIPYVHYDQQNSSVKQRILRKRYSIRVEFEQHGSLGMFSFSTLLIKLASGMGLLTLAATVIDIFALYLLPNRYKYREHVYEAGKEITKRKEE